MSENDHFSSHFVNRNPRNLELMSIELKDDGWETELPKRNFYNKVEIERTNKHTTVKVVHRNGKPIVSASTKEAAISRHLYSTSDVAALVNVTRVVAHRCLQYGITRLHFEVSDPVLAKSDTIRILKDTLTQCGVILGEADQVKAPIPMHLRKDWSSPFLKAKDDPLHTKHIPDLARRDHRWVRYRTGVKSAEDILIEATTVDKAPEVTKGKKK